MRTESDSAVVGVQLGESGSSGHCASPPSEAERSLIEAMHRFVLQIAETNLRLLMLADQNARVLEHVALLIDLLARRDDDDEDSDSERTYLDGSSFS